MNQKLIGPGLRKKQSFEHQLFFFWGGIIKVGIFHLEQENPSVFLSARQLWFLFAGGGIQATELFCFGFHRRKMKGPKWSTQGSLLFVGKFVALGVVFGKVLFFFSPDDIFSHNLLLGHFFHKLPRDQVQVDQWLFNLGEWRYRFGLVFRIFVETTWKTTWMFTKCAT